MYAVIVRTIVEQSVENLLIALRSAPQIADEYLSTRKSGVRERQKLIIYEIHDVSRSREDRAKGENGDRACRSAREAEDREAASCS